MKPFTSVSTLAATLSVMGAGPSPSVPHSVRGAGVSLHIAAGTGGVVSGYQASLRVSVINRSALPLWFADPRTSGRFFFCKMASRGRWVTAPLTRDGQSGIGALHGGNTRIRQTNMVGPGKSASWAVHFPLARYYDLTIPGVYRIQLITEAPVFLVGGKTQIYVRRGRYLYAATIGKSLYLPAFGSHPPRSPMNISSGRARSNCLTLAVEAPYRSLPRQILRKVDEPAAVGASAEAQFGLHVGLARPNAKGTGPFRIRTLFFFKGRKTRTLHLTGNPFVDFGRIQVTGPSYPGDYFVVKLPKPHDAPFISKSPTPLTAYGHWLAKHPVRGLKVKTYTLKPGVVYKYAEPINLSCMYDMSLAGVYRVRVELAHTHVWSPWANVKVP